MIADMMDARSQITHAAALVVRIATWLRGKNAGPTVPDHFGHNCSIVPCDALDGAGCEPDGMRMG